MVTELKKFLSAAIKAVFSPAVACATLVFAFSTGVAHGQTGYSLRMHALGAALSGIVDDAISDAYRNPARVGGVSGTRSGLYAGLLPGRALYLPFPELTSYWYDPVPREGVEIHYWSSHYLESRSYTPWAFTFFESLGGSMPLSATVEVAVSGDELTEETTSLYPDGFPVFDDIEQDARGNSRHSDFYHLLLDVAFAGSRPRADSRSTGVRLTMRYDAYKRADGRSYHEIETGVGNLTELVSDLDAWVVEEKYDEFDASLNFGLFRPGSTLRELVVGAGLVRQTGIGHNGRVEIYDEDFDGNGEDPYGFRPVYTYQRSLFESDRDYRALRLTGAMVLELGSGVRTTHSASWSEGYGDGRGFYRVDDEIYDGIVNELYNEALGHTYDGDTRQYLFTSAIGIAEEVYDGITVAAGARAYYRHSEFEEDADGPAEVRYVRPDTTFLMKSLFGQRIWHSGEWISLSVPASVEWEINSYLDLRIGLLFGASRREYEGGNRQSAEMLGEQIPFDDLSKRDEHYIAYSTGVSAVVGFALNLKERLILDFLDTSAGDFGFSYVSIRYDF
jgi:hypothetical protein